MLSKNILPVLVTVILSGGAATAIVEPPGSGPSGERVTPTRLFHGHGTGFDPEAEKAATEGMAVSTLQPRVTVPVSYDLSRFAPVAGNQGSVGSCTAWASSYTAVSLLMNEQGITDSPTAPMYIYAQIAKGRDRGASIVATLQMKKDQGIDTKSHYLPGDFDYTTQPTDDQRANAARYRIVGYDRIANGPGASQAVKTAISQGQPVIVAINLRYSFDEITPDNPQYSPGNDTNDPLAGYHAVTIIGYDEAGVRIENSWGTNWGDSGFFTTPWSTIESTSDVTAIYTMRRLARS